MNDVCSVACPMMAGNASVAVPRDASRSLLRWAVLGAAGVIALVLAMAHTGSVGAQAPCVQINYTTCVATGASYITGNVATPTTTNTGYPPNTVVSTYVDPRYGVVSVVTDASGNLIDVNAATGQRIYPVFPDYGYGAGYVAGNFIGNPAFINGNYAFNNAAFNGNYLFNGAYLNGNGCNFVNCAVNTFPAGGTVVGGVVYYNDNRFCGDGKVAFVPGRGYFCQNGAPLVPNGVTTVNCANFFTNGCGIYRPFEVSDTTTAPTATTVTAAPVATAPVAAPQMATALNTTPAQAPVAPTGGGDVHVLSVQPTAPAATTVDRDDHQG